jgi:4-hydroxy-3-polyprenylbenzoate decarboxylase
VIRELCTEAPQALKELQGFQNPQVCIPGVVALQGAPFTTYADAVGEMSALNEQLSDKGEALQATPIIVLCDDSSFTAQTLNNFLWVAFTRCNPSHDIHGVASFVENKHWGCRGPLVIDARVKPHHAPPLVKDPEVEKRVDRLFTKGGSLHGVIK